MMNLAPTKNPIVRWLYKHFALWIAQHEAMKTQLDGTAWTRVECRHCHKWIETDADAVFCPRCGLRLHSPASTADVERVTDAYNAKAFPASVYVENARAHPDYGPRTQATHAIRLPKLRGGE